MLAADAPPAAPPADKPAEMVVISRDAHSDILTSLDSPLPLIRGRRTEDAVLRQAISLTTTLTVARPAAGPGEDILRWTYRAYLQRQLCFTSITGQFSCATAEAEELPENASGEVPLAPPAAPVEVSPGQTVQAVPAPAAPPANPAAEAARLALATALRGRAAVLFDNDRRLKIEPMLKAAGVRVLAASFPVYGGGGPKGRRGHAASLPNAPSVTP